MMLEKTDFDLNQIIRNTAASFEGTCRAKKLAIELVLTDDLMLVNGDVTKIQQVLYNLIDNAIRALEDFSGDNKKIRVNITETPERYIFGVEDNGPKIPEDYRENIFKKGFSTKKEEGHGMGLAIVSEILSKNGGDIELSSDDEETVFTVSFEKGE
jgi:signal transduction histidine kinase